jgi:hypothetical protein
MGNGLMQQGPRPYRLRLADKIIQTARAHTFRQRPRFGHGLLCMGFEHVHGKTLGFWFLVAG